MADVLYSQRFVEDSLAINRAVLGCLLSPLLWASLPHTVQSWLRNYLASLIVYFLFNSLWCSYIYYWKHNVYVPKDAIPSRKVVMTQIYVSMKSLPWTIASATFSEYLTENGWTKCYYKLSEVGLISYLLHLSAYLVLTEVCIYWAHRSMHEIKPLYKYFHVVHHKFNKPNTLSPFAGIAFHPVDAIVNSLPHVLLPCILPLHFSTQKIILSIDYLWVTSTHDCVHAKMWPAMGAGYHTIHHCSNRYNYGHRTILMDWIFGTLRNPSEDRGGCKKMS